MNDVFDGYTWNVIRKTKNLTVAEVAKKIGVNKRTVTKWFAGTIKPRLGHMLSLAKVLGIPETQILAKVTDTNERAAIRYALSLMNTEK